MHPWHDIPLEQSMVADGFPVGIEVSRGSTNKHVCEEPVVPMALVQARAIGMFQMRDETGEDDKIVAVSLGDPAFRDYGSHGPHAVVRVILRAAKMYGDKFTSFKT